MRKIAVLIILLILLLALFSILTGKDKIETNNISKVGFVSESGFSYVSDNLIFTYSDKSDTSSAKLQFNDGSKCKFGSETEIQCIAISSPLINILRDKKILIEGTYSNGTLLVRNLAILPD